MTIWVATVAALLAAGLFAVSTALQHHSAGEVPDLTTFGRRDLARFAGGTFRHPAWLVGTAADAAGLALHALALSRGPLTLVQPLLVTGVVFALPLRHRIDHRRPSAREVGCAVALAGGLATFLTVSVPTSATTAAPDRLPAAVTVAAVVAATLACTWWGRHLRGASAAAVLGLATGLTFAASAALIKTITTTLGHHPLAVLVSWPLYALIGVGVVGLLLNQMAFQAGPLEASLPVMTASDPLVSLIIGVAVYDEQLRTGAWALAGEGVSLALVLAAAMALSRVQAATKSGVRLAARSPEASSPRPG